MINSISKESYLKSKEEKVSINELISISNYSIEVTKVPPIQYYRERILWCMGRLIFRWRP